MLYRALIKFPCLRDPKLKPPPLRYSPSSLSQEAEFTNVRTNANKPVLNVKFPDLTF